MWGEDVRVRDKTKKKIASSLMNLVEKKPIDKITITDITVNCDISRQVFYKFIYFPPSGEFAFNLRP